jgi:hypothetical protein
VIGVRVSEHDGTHRAVIDCRQCLLVCSGDCGEGRVDDHVAAVRHDEKCVALRHPHAAGALYTGADRLVETAPEIDDTHGVSEGAARRRDDNNNPQECARHDAPC